MRARALAAPVVLAGAVLLIAPHGFAASPRLAPIVLTPAQVGPAYRLVVRSDSTCLSRCATLDLCGFSFASESLRIERLQVNYVRPGRPVALSNEVVRYRPGGATEALAEVRRAVARCPSARTLLVGRHLLPGSLALRLRVSGGTGGARVNEIVVVVYQAHGDLLSGVYSYAAAGITLADQIRTGLRAAEASARNLVRSHI